MVAAGADLTYPQDNRKSAFDYAWDIILLGIEDSNTLGTLRNLFLSYDYTEHRGFSRLHKIVLGILHYELATELTRSDVDVDAPDSMGRSALSWAAQRGDIVAVKTLITAQANLNLCEDLRKPPLFWAFQAPTLACAELLLQHGADATISNFVGENALHYASYYHDSTAIVKTLLTAGVDANMVSKEGYTALFNAARKGHLKLAKALLEGGADINTLDIEGDSLLMSTLFDDQVMGTAFLLEKGADYIRINIYDESILHYTAKGSSGLETLDVLEAAMLKGIDPDAISKHGKTAMQLAQQNPSKPEHFVERFELLLAGIRERNKIINASVPSPRGTLNSQKPVQYIFQRLQSIWGSLKTTSAHSARSTLGLYMLLGLGWIAFFCLLLRPDSTTTQSLQSLKPTKVHDDAFAKLEALPRELGFRPPVPSSDNAIITQPTQNSLRKSYNHAGQGDRGQEGEEREVHMCRNIQVAEIFRFYSMCPSVSSEDQRQLRAVQ